jgi:hypothetical protein
MFGQTELRCRRPRFLNGLVMLRSFTEALRPRSHCCEEGFDAASIIGAREGMVKNRGGLAY